MPSTIVLSGVIAEHIAAVNAFDLDALMATFADDALVNDARREFRGSAEIRRWAARELIGDRVTVEVTEVTEHYGDVILRGRYDGNFDKSALPDDLILTNYIRLSGGRLVSLLVIRNVPAGY